MKLIKSVGMLGFIAVLGVAVAVVAEQPGSGMTKQDHQMGGMQQQGMPGMGMMRQDKQMSGMQGCPMMQDMKDQQQLMLEMKKHMQMMDKTMEMMMQRRQEMTAPGGESAQQEHHPKQSQ